MLNDQKRTIFASLIQLFTWEVFIHKSIIFPQTFLKQAFVASFTVFRQLKKLCDVIIMFTVSTRLIMYIIMCRKAILWHQPFCREVLFVADQSNVLFRPKRRPVQSRIGHTAHKRSRGFVRSHVDRRVDLRIQSRDGFARKT